MTDEIKINIENVNFKDSVEQTRFYLLATVFGAYRAAGKEREEAYLLALKDLSWFAERAQAHLQKLSSDDA